MMRRGQKMEKERRKGRGRLEPNSLCVPKKRKRKSRESCVFGPSRIPGGAATRLSWWALCMCSIAAARSRPCRGVKREE
jgi:hypothetical protein